MTACRDATRVDFPTSDQYADADRMSPHPRCGTPFANRSLPIADSMNLGRKPPRRGRSRSVFAHRMHSVRALRVGSALRIHSRSLLLNSGQAFFAEGNG